MASTKFLEEDLRTDVDEFTDSAIVGGSTDTNIVTATSDAKSPQKPPQEQLSDFQQHLLNDNNNLLNSNQDNNNSSSSAILVSNGHQSSANSEPNNALDENERKFNNNVNINYNIIDSEPPVLANFGNFTNQHAHKLAHTYILKINICWVKLKEQQKTHRK